MGAEAEGRMWMNRKVNESECIWLINATSTRELLESEGYSMEFIKGAIQELSDRKMSV